MPDRRPNSGTPSSDLRDAMADAHVKIMCPSLTCRKVLSVPAIARGKTVRCKACATVIRIPEKAPAIEIPHAVADAAPAPSGKGKEKAA